MDKKNTAAAENAKKGKHQALEMIEGGLCGKRSARIFNWTVFILIILSNSFFLASKAQPVISNTLIFVVAELFTIILLTTEIVIGFWTADVRFPEEKHPRLKYLRQPMTIIGILALMPFYLGLVLVDPKFNEFTEYLDYLMLLHLVKAWEIMKTTRPDS